MYRAKSIENDEWVFGYLFETKEDSYIGYKNCYDDDLFLSPENIFVKIDKNTVCRMIDYEKDDNDKDIYLNDIVLCESGEEYMGYREFRKYFIVDDYHETICAIQECENVKVVGNIFDNVELIKKCVNGGEF